MYLIYIGKDFKKICKHPNLTTEFIDEYFWRLKPFRIRTKSGFISLYY